MSGAEEGVWGHFSDPGRSAGSRKFASARLTLRGRRQHSREARPPLSSAPLPSAPLSSAHPKPFGQRSGRTLCTGALPRVKASARATGRSANSRVAGSNPQASVSRRANGALDGGYATHEPIQSACARSPPPSRAAVSNHPATEADERGSRPLNRAPPSNSLLPGASAPDVGPAEGAGPKHDTRPEICRPRIHRGGFGRTSFSSGIGYGLQKWQNARLGLIWPAF